MKRIAVAWIAVYLALAFAYDSVLGPRLDSPAGAVVLSLLVATFTVAFLGSIVALPMAVRDALAIWRSLSAASFEDGKRAAAVGPLRPLGRPLRSPFEGTPCVAYSYAIERARRDDDTGGRVADFRGLALTPSAIAAPQGLIRLLGYPNLDSFPARFPSDEPSFQRAEAYLASAPFETIGSASSIVSDFGKLMAVFTGNESGVRKDYRLPGASDPPERDADGAGAGPSKGAVSWLLSAGYGLSETCIPVETTVSAVGIYSADRNGIGSSSDGSTVLQLVQGDGGTAPRRLLLGAMARLATATLLCGAIHGGLWLWLSSAGGHAIPARLRPSITNAVQAGDVVAVRKALAGGADPNLNESGAPPLFYAAERGDVEMVKALLEAGARTEERDMYGSTALMGAATYGHTEVVKALIAAGSDVNAKNSKFGTTALDATIEDAHVEAADALRAGGAIDETVTAKSGRSLPAGGGEPFSVCRRFLQAVFARDPATMQALWERPGVGFDKVDWDIYQSVRTAEPRLMSGFTTGDAATLFLRGPSTDGRENVLRYQLVRSSADVASGWKIRREWILPSAAGVP